MAFELTPLPYELNALEPHISARTMDFHYNKHYAGYVKKLNELVANTALAKVSLEEIVRSTAEDSRPAQVKIFNNAAQSWSHAFLWSCMTPKPMQLKGLLKKRIEDGFGGLDGFKKSFVSTATQQFGSGYAWLVLADGELKIRSTSNAKPPFVEDQTVLLACDVWEHAYYLDYQNRRKDFVTAFVEHLINWEFVADRLSQEHEAAA
jgi:Fe-Mn family superoxide dismutase